MLLDKSIKELSQLLKKKKISCVDLVKESFDSINNSDSVLNSFITLRDKKDVLIEAEKKDHLLDNSSTFLYGIPYSLKDCFVTKGIKTTSASNVLKDFISPYNASVYEKISHSGGILIGKNNMDAWGHGGSTENTDFKVGRNPWDIKRVQGGSSGGPAASIASRMVSFAIGEDTGGSIRNPAGICNISGLKVTYGRVSRYGSIAYASSLDSIGPMAKNVEDLAIILENIAGIDKKDATSSLNSVENYSNNLNTSIKNKKIGLPKEFFGIGLNAEVKSIILNAAKTFEKLGAEVVEVSIPYIKYGISTYYLIAMCETSSNLARYDGIRYGESRENFSPETLRRILIGTYALSAGYADKLYKKAQKARTVLIEEFNDVFKKCDVILAPIIPGKTRKIGELTSDPLQNLLEDLYTVTANLVGIPSLAIPAGFILENEKSLPVGMQIMGKKFAEQELFQFGYAYQNKTDWHTRKPPFANLKV